MTGEFQEFKDVPWLPATALTSLGTRPLFSNKVGRLIGVELVLNSIEASYSNPCLGMAEGTVDCVCYSALGGLCVIRIHE